jgi:hypothetical protein
MVFKPMLQTFVNRDRSPPLDFPSNRYQTGCENMIVPLTLLKKKRNKRKTLKLTSMAAEVSMAMAMGPFDTLAKPSLKAILDSD